MAFGSRGELAYGHDAFGRLPVSQPVTLFDSQNQYDTNPLLWEDVLTAGGTATHVADTASVQLSVTANGDAVTRTTRQYHRYQPGKSQLVLTTGCFGAAGDLYIVKRSNSTGSVVNTEVPQSGWMVNSFNDGSRTHLDASKTQIFAIDMEWLGVGSVRTGFVIDGAWQHAHSFHHANFESTTYMTTANLPVRYEIEQAAGVVTKRMGYFDDENGFYLEWRGTDQDFCSICCTVISEGGFEEGRGLPFATSNGVTTRGVTTRAPIISIRPKATFNSIVNRGQILLKSLSGYAESNPGYYELVYGGTVSGGSWASVDDNSIVEVNKTCTGIANGQVISTYNVGASGGFAAMESPITTGFNGRLPLCLDAAGANPIPLTLVVTSHAGTCNASGGFDWLEIR